MTIILIVDIAERLALGGFPFFKFKVSLAIHLLFLRYQRLDKLRN